MPAVPGSMYAANQQPSCWTKMKTGFTIGFCVGMASGALFGGFSALRCVPKSHSFTLISFSLCYGNSIESNHFITWLHRYGARGRELINNVGKVMIQGGGTFGTFMAIGTGIRCWSKLLSMWMWIRRKLHSTVVQTFSSSDVVYLILMKWNKTWKLNW